MGSQTAANKRWYANHREQEIRRARDHKRKVRREAIEHYGGVCDCCGENRYEFLAIDHIDGGGTAHRRELGTKGHNLAGWLRKEGYPEGFRILCHNCNSSIGFYGYCPHQTEKAKLNGRSDIGGVSIPASREGDGRNG